MAHLSRSEISRLVGIKYKGSSSDDDLVFLKKAMDHIVICSKCKEQFKEKTELLIKGLNYRIEQVKEKKSMISLCQCIYEQGKVLIQTLTQDYHVSYCPSLSFARDDDEEVPDYIIQYDQQTLSVMTFEENEIYIEQDHKMIEPSSKVKNPITYEYVYTFDCVDIEKPFNILVNIS